MKKTIAVLLTLICLLTCTGVCAETAVSADELIPEVLAEVYGEPAVFSVSVVGDMFATKSPMRGRMKEPTRWSAWSRCWPLPNRSTNTTTHSFSFS